jgi:hypothetical protein
MSTNTTTVDDGDDAGALTKAYRSVSPRYESHGNAEMDSIGWAMFLGIVVILVPLLPFLVVVWALEKLVGAVAGRGRNNN